MAFNHFRIFMTLLAAFAAFFAYICRLNLSMTITDMVATDEKSNVTKCHEQLSHFETVSKLSWKYQSFESIVSSPVNTSSESPVPVANASAEHLLSWSQDEQNELLGAFFIGYVALQIPSARASEIFGAKILFLMTGLGAALCSLVFPLAAKSFDGIIVPYIVRIVLGASQGALFPTAYVFLCEWLPPKERTKWLPVPSAFSRFGTIVMYLVLPIIFNRFGWEAVFYVSGLGSLAWCLVFLVFGANSPAESYWISKAELSYIESHMDPQEEVGAKRANGSTFTLDEPSAAQQVAVSDKPALSWLKLVSNKAIMILSLVMFTSEWSNMLLLVKLRGFLTPVFNMDMSEYGYWSSFLIVVFCIQYPLSSFCASKLETLSGYSSLKVRKIFEGAAHAMQAIGCFMIAFSDNKLIVIGALFIMMLGRSTVGGGQCLMPPELSKEYPGTVFAFANTIANVAGVIGPETIKWMVSDCKQHSSWFGLWILSGFIFLFGGIVFCLFADNKPQNYSRKPRPGKSLSRVELTMDKNPEEIFKMDAFSRVSSEPNPNPGSIGLRRLDSTS